MLKTLLDNRIITPFQAFYARVVDNTHDRYIAKGHPAVALAAAAAAAALETETADLAAAAAALTAAAATAAMSSPPVRMLQGT